MKIPQLRKQPEKKSCHGYNWIDEYSWIHQDNCLEILRDPNKLNPEVRKYLESENACTKESMKNTEIFQKKLFKEIEGRIKLDDEGLPYRDKQYEYWTKTTKEGNYFKKLRRKIGNSKIECYFDADKEAKGKKFFNCGDLTVSYNDKLLIYSIDEKGSEYFTIFVRNISDGKIIEKIDLVELIKNAAKQNIFIFDSRFYIYQNYDFENLKTSDLDIIKTPDPTHFNKVDVLDSKKASYFNLFLKGDYLISSRNLNLVFVYRPSTKKIIWYTIGRTSRQHDSTFQNGHIMVFDNNPYTSTGSSLVKFSENDPLNPIERINLKKKYGIHAEWRGNFEYYDYDNTLLVSNDDRGQIIYAKLDGNDKFIFNNGTERKRNLITFASLKVEPEFIVKNEKKCK